MIEISINKLLRKGGMRMLVEMMKDRPGMTKYLVHRGHKKEKLDKLENLEVQYEFTAQLEKDKKEDEVKKLKHPKSFYPPWPISGGYD